MFKFIRSVFSFVTSSMNHVQKGDVEIVRCKDCRKALRRSRHKPGMVFCPLYGDKADDGYCDQGERGVNPWNT